MQSRFRLAGHGVQPLLLMFPLGLFWTAFLFDLATLLGAPAMIGTVAFWNLVAGLGGGVLAALAAVFDAVSADSPAVARVFCLALLLDVGVLIVFAVLALMRVRDPDRAVSASLLVVEAGGLAAAAFGAWFGGRLAHPGAPVADPRSPRHGFPGITADDLIRPAAGHAPRRHPANDRPQQPVTAPPARRPGPAPRTAAAHSRAAVPGMSPPPARPAGRRSQPPATPRPAPRTAAASAPVPHHPAASAPMTPVPRPAAIAPMTPAARPAAIAPMTPAARPAAIAPMTPVPRPAAIVPVPPVPRPAAIVPVPPVPRPAVGTARPPAPHAIVDAARS